MIDNLAAHSEAGLLNGEFVFNLIDSHGLPLEMILDRCCEQRLVINWSQFIETAWKRNWYSYQIYDKVMFAFAESLSYSNNHVYRKEIQIRLQKYILEYDQTLKQQLHQVQHGYIISLQLILRSKIMNEVTYVEIVTTIVKIIAIWTTIGLVVAIGIAKWMHHDNN